MNAWWPWVLVLVALALVYGPSLAVHMARGFDPLILNDDARQQIYPFFRYADSSLFPNDYAADYYLDCLPLGFRALYTFSAPLIDPAVSAKVVMYLMLLTTVMGLGVAANRLGGKVAAWAVMSLALGASLYLDRLGTVDDMKRVPRKPGKVTAAGVEKNDRPSEDEQPSPRHASLVEVACERSEHHDGRGDEEISLRVQSQRRA